MRDSRARRCSRSNSRERERHRERRSRKSRSRSRSSSRGSSRDEGEHHFRVRNKNRKAVSPPRDPGIARAGVLPNAKRRSHDWRDEIDQGNLCKILSVLRMNFYNMSDVMQIKILKL